MPINAVRWLLVAPPTGSNCQDLWMDIFLRLLDGCLVRLMLGWLDQIA